MTCEVLGEGREVLHSCDKWTDLVDWFQGYTSGGSGGWSWFELKRDGKVAARFVISKQSSYEEDYAE